MCKKIIIMNCVVSSQGCIQTALVRGTAYHTWGTVRGGRD